MLVNVTFTPATAAPSLWRIGFTMVVLSGTLFQFVSTPSPSPAVEKSSLITSPTMIAPCAVPIARAATRIPIHAERLLTPIPRSFPQHWSHAAALARSRRVTRPSNRAKA